MVLAIQEIQPYEERRVTQAKSYTRRFKILISSINYKGKILFLWCYISYMEINVNDHK